jgi:hypothetical protein
MLSDLDTSLGIRPYEDLFKAAEAACYVPPPETEADPVLKSVFDSFAEDDQQATSMAQTLSEGVLSSVAPDAIFEVSRVLNDYGRAVVRNPAQIRHLVTNKLLLETGNPDPRVRIRALELLGKITDVGLFTDRTEATINQRTTIEIKQTLLEKLDRLRTRASVLSGAGVRPQEIIEAVIDQ